MLVFLRHFGCTFCRETLADVARHRDAIAATGAQVAFVHMSRPAEADRWFAGTRSQTSADQRSRKAPVSVVRIGGGLAQSVGQPSRLVAVVSNGGDRTPWRRRRRTELASAHRRLRRSSRQSARWNPTWRLDRKARLRKVLGKGSPRWFLTGVRRWFFTTVRLDGKGEPSCRTFVELM